MTIDSAPKTNEHGRSETPRPQQRLKHVVERVRVDVGQARRGSLGFLSQRLQHVRRIADNPH